jgi:hypothetical protein
MSDAQLEILKSVQFGVLAALIVFAPRTRDWPEWLAFLLVLFVIFLPLAVARLYR